MDNELEIDYFYPSGIYHLPKQFEGLSDPNSLENIRATEAFTYEMSVDHRILDLAKDRLVHIKLEDNIINVYVNNELAGKSRALLFDLNEEQLKEILNYQLPEDVKFVCPPNMTDITEEELIQSDPFHPANMTAASKYVDTLKEDEKYIDMVKEGKMVRIYWHPDHCVINVIVDNEIEQKYQARMYDQI